MRKNALLIGLLIGLVILNTRRVVHADEGMSACPACQGVVQETPNERRERLGLPIKMSYPPRSYGQTIETPNERRRRLGLPIVQAAPTVVTGVVEETPNEKRRRLASQTALATLN